jgi:hypothetical protein
MKIRHAQNFWSGVLFIAFGLAFALGARDYDMGSMQRMGPAYFPTMLGVLLALLGLIVALRALVDKGGDGTIARFRFGPLLSVLGGVAAFALLLRPAGLVIALAALIGIGALGSHVRRWREIAMLGVALAVLVPALFVAGLGLVIPLWPAFVAR